MTVPVEVGMSSVAVKMEAVALRVLGAVAEAPSADEVALESSVRESRESRAEGEEEDTESVRVELLVLLLSLLEEDAAALFL